MPNINVSVRPEPPIVAQEKTRFCWAAVTACILSWRTGITIPDSEAARQLGPQFQTIYESNQPLLMAEVGNWARVAALKQMPPTNITVGIVNSVLSKNKPLIIGKANADGMGHLVVAYSLSGNEDPNRTNIEFVEPDGGGSKSSSTFLTLAAQFESLAPVGNIVYAQLFEPL